MKKIVIIISVILVLAGLGAFAVVLVRQRGLAEMSPGETSTQTPPLGTSLPAGQTPGPGGATSPPATVGGSTMGILPPEEDAPPAPTEGSSNDTDGDGLSDEEEAARGTDPKKADTDGDALNDMEEARFYCTDPKDPTTNGDQPDAAWVRSKQDEAEEKGQRPQFCVN